MLTTRVLLAATVLTLAAGACQAQSVQGQFNVQMTITKTCAVSGTGTLTLAPADNLAVAGTQGSTAFDVQCTNTTPYSIALNKGSHASGTTATRLMTLTAGTETVPYQLFQDSGRTQNWGDTVGETKGGLTGSGNKQSHTVYGKVSSAQTTAPAPGLYSDIVTVTVTY
jgi:spore coat protein U-like protein